MESISEHGSGSESEDISSEEDKADELVDQTQIIMPGPTYIDDRVSKTMPEQKITPKMKMEDINDLLALISDAEDEEEANHGIDEKQPPRLPLQKGTLSTVYHGRETNNSF